MPLDEEDEDADLLAHQRADALKASTGDIRRVLDRYFAMHDRAAAPESSTGGILEKGRLGLVSDPDEWRRHTAAEHRLQEHALLVKLWQAIKPLPTCLIQLSLTAVGWQRYLRLAEEGELLTPAAAALRQHGLCLEGLESGGLCRRPIAPGAFTCSKHLQRTPEAGRGGTTARGETFLRNAKAEDFPDRQHKPGFVMVQGLKDIFPSYRLIAEALSEPWDKPMGQKKPQAGKTTSLEQQLANTADAGREILLAAHLRLEELRQKDGPLAARAGEVPARKVKYVMEVAFDELRGSDWLRLLLAEG